MTYEMHDDDEPITLADYFTADDDLTPGDDFVPVLDDDDSPPARFVLASERAAVWAMRKLAARRATIAEHNATAQAEIERLRNWQVRENTKLLDDCSFFEGLLVEWQAKNIESEFGMNPLRGTVDPERWRKFRQKTRMLPNGEIAARISSGSFAAPNADIAVQFLNAVGRDDLLVHRDPTVASTPLEDAIKGGTVEIDRDGHYWARVAVDVIENEGRVARMYENITAAHEFRLDDWISYLPQAAQFREQDPAMRLTRELGQHAQAETWVRIPGVMKTGVGLVTISPKPIEEA